MFAMPASPPARRKPGRKLSSPRPPTPPSDLSVEIAILRKAIHKVSEMSEAEAPDLSTRLDAMAAIGMAINRLAGALKTQRELQGNDSEIDLAITQALADVAKELGIS